MYETILLDLLNLVFPLVVGLASLIFYIRIRKSGMLVIAIAFFLDGGERILFSATMMQYYAGSGFPFYTLGLCVFVGDRLFQSAFAILITIGLFLLCKEMKQLSMK